MKVKQPNFVFSRFSTDDVIRIFNIISDSYEIKVIYGEYVLILQVIFFPVHLLDMLNDTRKEYHPKEFWTLLFVI